MTVYAREKARKLRPSAARARRRYEQARAALRSALELLAELEALWPDEAEPLSLDIYKRLRDLATCARALDARYGPRVYRAGTWWSASK